MTSSTSSILGYDVFALNGRLCVEQLVDSIITKHESDSPRTPRWLACLNPHSYVVALDDKQFLSALHGADWLIPDGAGVVFASKLLREPINERVTGSDVFFGVQERLNELKGFSVFFLGSTEDVLAEIKVRMAKDYPNLVVAGTYSPPFKSVYTEQELQEMADAVNSAAPDVLWVGMTAPKQEKWIAEMISRLDVGIAAAVGAVFDFYTGRVKRSHPIFQRLGLEWLPRLVQQPRRLWRRMFISAPIFVWHILLVKIGLLTPKNP